MQGAKEYQKSIKSGIAEKSPVEIEISACRRHGISEKVEVKYSEKRNRSVTIQPVATTAPWIRLTEAARQSGLNRSEIRDIPGIRIRKFGNAYYVNPNVVNAWILEQ